MNPRKHRGEREQDREVPAIMDDYMFQWHVKGCKNVTEATTYLEIFNYSV